ncbi:MAG TPA: RHS repeat-associated core domain-containing protein [Chloroflexota bacterium]|nr:RHS repeat-associated core domain-containing protein [Chloroflexota bacterium]
MRRIDPSGTISTVAGIGPCQIATAYCTTSNGSPPTTSFLTGPSSIAVAPDGSLYINDYYDGQISRIAAPLPGFTGNQIAVPSSDGSLLYQFDRSGRLLSTVNALTGTPVFQFTYDANGKLIKVQDANGNVTTIQRDASENPVAIISPYGQKTTLGLTPDGFLASVTDPAGNTTRLGYGSGGLLTSVAGPNGNTYRFGYDSSGLLTSATTPDGGQSTLSASSTANTSTVIETSALGRSATFQVQTADTGAQTLTTIYPDGTQEQEIRGADGSITIQAPSGQQSTVTLSPDPRFGMQSALSTQQSMTMPSGLTYSRTAAATDVLSDPTNPLSLVSETHTLMINGRAFSQTYDAASRTLTTTSPAGRVVTMTLNTQGEISRVQNGPFAPQTYSYDSQGRMVAITDGTSTNARTTSFQYGSDGKPSALINPLGQTVTYQRDADGRVTQVTQPDGTTISYTYDANGNLTSITPPGQAAHQFSYNGEDQLSRYQPPAVAEGTTPTQYSYDLDRELTQVTRPDGQVINYGYDANGRLTSVTTARGTYRFSFDPKTGQMTTISAPNGVSQSYTYDGGLLTGVSWAGPVTGSIARTYDVNLDLSSLSVDGANPITFQYDPDGLLTRAGALSLNRDASSGFVTGTSLGTLKDTVTYDSFGDVASYLASANGSEIYGYSLQRDALGRIIQKSETVGATTNVYTYTYDLQGRLIKVSQNGTVTASYNYDSNGNRLNVTGESGTTTGSYDAQDRLLQYGSTNYTYNANGDRQTATMNGQTTNYQYDALGNLIAVTLPNGEQIQYLIDGQNRRIGKLVNGTQTAGFLYQNGLAPVAQLDGSNNVVTRFVYASRSTVPDYLIKGGVTYRIITDPVGSPILVVNTQNGQIAEQITYDEYGNVLSDSNPGFQPFGFAGGLYDPDTGLVRFGARDYDPRSGRWLTKDPSSFQGQDTNLYSYAHDDPVSLSDPSGQGPQPGPEGNSNFYQNDNPFSYWFNTSLDALGGPGTAYYFWQPHDNALAGGIDGQLSLNIGGISIHGGINAETVASVQTFGFIPTGFNGFSPHSGLYLTGGATVGWVGVGGSGSLTANVAGNADPNATWSGPFYGANGSAGPYTGGVFGGGGWFGTSFGTGASVGPYAPAVTGGGDATYYQPVFTGDPTESWF